jgi:peptide methionine sulfoxide reductase msrA/msrB
MRTREPEPHDMPPRPPHPKSPSLSRSPLQSQPRAAATRALWAAGAVAAALLLVSGRAVFSDRTATAGTSAGRAQVLSTKTYRKPPAAEFEKALDRMQYDVTQKAATEPPFRNAFWDNHRPGLYVDVVTGEPLFSSTDKFDSGTGWPSFTQPVEPNRVIEHEDSSLGMTRVEVRSVAGGSHLGHVFDDGPAPTHARYCINSASLRFIPVDQLEASGYGAYRPLFPAGRETAILAGGCFWGMEEILRSVPGVIETEAVYTGGKMEHPTYSDVHTGETGHAEAVRVVFDPKRLSYADLLEKWFFRMHDPTTRNRQGNDVGTQYRSAIFVTSAEQRKIAEDVKARVDRSGKWKSPIVTEIVAAGPVTRAEEYHQKYLEKNPGGYTCHYLRN